MVTNRHIFIINGKPTAGKDTFVNMVATEAKFHNIDVLNISTVDKVKEAATILGWNGIKSDSARLFLSELKDLSTKFFDGPAKYCYGVANTLKEDQIMFIHCREPKEIEKMKNMLDCFTVYIDRTLDNEKFSNHADAEVTNYKYDYVIDNNASLKELRNRANTFLNTVIDFDYYWRETDNKKLFARISNPTDAVFIECKSNQRLT